MLTKRIIPCLDVKDGRTVKGTNFTQLRDAGDPVELGRLYAQQGADELVYLDISATQEARQNFTSLVREVARHLDIPFTVGGGIGSVSDVESLLEAGADKVTINSAAVANPDLIDELAKQFGSQLVVVAVDARLVGNQWTVFTHGGTRQTERKLFSWAKEVQDRGAGEILFTSMDHDGTKSGYAIDPLNKLSQWLSIPVVASGGAGKREDFLSLFRLTQVDAALAAGVFHFGEIALPTLKTFLAKNGIAVR
ncbi:MAG: imidazole glycerol phosphate synthase subunit HisF [Cyclobacteriaceae bacterium]|nr:imidazole glycerol phosphate synthase subunit HisF [Cyclobacteriaceae bacterium]